MVCPIDFDCEPWPDVLASAVGVSVCLSDLVVIINIMLSWSPPPLCLYRFLASPSPKCARRPSSPKHASPRPLCLPLCPPACDFVSISLPMSSFPFSFDLVFSLPPVDINSFGTCFSPFLPCLVFCSFDFVFNILLLFIATIYIYSQFDCIPSLSLSLSLF